MYTKKTKLIGAMLAIIMLLQVLCSSITSVVLAAEAANETTITFEDENLYIAIKEALGEKIKKTNDETLTIVMTNSNISKVSSLNLSGKGIEDLAGIQNFTELTDLDLSDNEIEDINWLAGSEGKADSEEETESEEGTEEAQTDDEEETTESEENTPSLKNLVKLDLSNNHIEDVSVLEDTAKFPSLKKENISVGSQDLKTVEIFNKTKGENVTHNLPQIFTYIYEKNKDLNHSNIATQGDILQGLTVSNIDYEGMKIDINNVQSEGMMKVSFEFGDGFGAETRLTTYVIVITDPERKGIKFEDINLYNAVKDNLDVMEDEDGNPLFTKANKAEKYWNDNSNTKRVCVWYDEPLTLVIDKNYLYKDIVDLDLNGKQIEDIEGLQYFVGLEEVDLSDNFISDVEVLNKFAEEKEIAEADLKNIISAKHAELKTYIEEKEAYNELLSLKGKTNAINAKLTEINSYINGLNETTVPSIDNDSKQNLTKWFLNNIKLDLLVEAGLNDNATVNDLISGTEVVIGEVKHKLEGGAEETAYNKATINNNSIEVTSYEWDKDENDFVDKGGTIYLDSDIVDEIVDKFKLIQKINNGIVDGVDVKAKRNEKVQDIIKKVEEIDKYYDFENLLLIISKEEVELDYDSFKEVDLYTINEAKTAATTIIQKFIDNYDKLTTREISVGSVPSKDTLEAIKTSITDPNSSGYIGNNKNELIAITKEYIQKQIDILEGSYNIPESPWVTSLATMINYKEYIVDSLTAISEGYINADNDNQLRKNILNIIERTKNVNLDEVVALPRIKMVDLSSNNLRKIDDIAKMDELLKLVLKDNVISNIPDLTNFKKLYHLDLSHNMIYSPVIGTITNLQELNLENNKIKDITPAEIDFKNFVKLQKLDLSGNEISDLRTIMYNLYLLSKNQKMNNIEQILKTIDDEPSTFVDGSLTPALGISTDFAKFEYKVDVDKLDIGNQSIYATAAKKFVQNAVATDYVYLPEIFKQAKQINSYKMVSGVETKCSTTFLHAKAYNNGMILYLDTSRLGEQATSAAIEGNGVASGTVCTVTYTVATQEEIDKVPATSIIVQEEVVLEDENSKKPDLNADGKVSTEDLNMLKNGIAGITVLTNEQLLLSDIVPDKMLDMNDVLLLEQYIKISWQNSKLTLEQRENATKADVDLNKIVDEEDLRLLALSLLGNTNVSGNFNQDINADGKVDFEDLMLLSKYVASKSTERRNTDAVTLSILNDYKEERNLYASVLPEEADRDVTWVSNNENIVKIVETDDENARIKIEAVGEGTTTITVASKDNTNVYRTIRVDVVKAANVVEEIRIVEPAEGEKGLKTDYYVGQELDLSNAKIEVIRRDGSKEIIDITKEMLEGFSTEEVGEKIVTITYENVTTTFNLKVTKYEAEKATLTIDNLDVKLPENVVYDGKEHLAEVTLKEGVLAGELTVKYKDASDNNIEKPVNAGTYKVIVEIADSVYANAATIEVGTFTIAKAELPQEQRPAIATEYTIEKGGKLDIKVENGAIVLPEGTTFDEVGTKDITLTFVPNDANYAKIEIPVKVNVVISVKGVNLNKTEYTITKGGVTNLVATVMPENATNKNVTWSTSDATIATVEDGKVTAVGVGEAIITVTTKDGGKTATCRITVREQVYKVATLSDGRICITEINPETTEEIFRDKFNSENTYKIFKKDGKTEMSKTDVIGTGYILKVYDKQGTVVDEQILVVKGDTNGDGKASATDSGAILAHRTGEKSLTNEYLLAADINGDGSVDGRDSTLLIYHRIGMAGYILQNN